ncbi:MAG TPA: hypothetical protein VGI40_02000 [Pirellulaceae bacterium]
MIRDIVKPNDLTADPYLASIASPSLICLATSLPIMLLGFFLFGEVELAPFGVFMNLGVDCLLAFFAVWFAHLFAIIALARYSTREVVVITSGVFAVATFVIVYFATLIVWFLFPVFAWLLGGS